ncbi:MAG: deaminase [Streptosporangiales bacterium]|nr:deaminase [Streptosporangiales bacterium]
MPGKVLWHVTMSLDGYIAGPDDSMDWVPARAPSAERAAVAERVVAGTGAILAGRRWYELTRTRLGGTAGIYGGRWRGPVFVLTHRPPRPPESIEDPAITFLSGGVERAIHTALIAATGRDVVLFGADIPRQALALRLVDELVVHVAPVLLGGGVRLYGEGGAVRARLETVEVTRTGDQADLRFRVRGRAPVRAGDGSVATAVLPI